MNNYRIIRASGEDLDLIKPLWEKLNRIHFDLTDNFKDRYRQMTWEKRKIMLIEKSQEIICDYAVEIKTDCIVGYCISSIGKIDNSTGEIDSLFIEETFRKTGLGKKFMNRAIDWFASKNVETQKIIVFVGNEKVIDFYKKFGFYPLSVILQKV